jgi:uncharacterized protein (TIGR01777 family)
MGEEEKFIARTELPVGAGDVYEWHAREGAFERLQPPWERVEVTRRSGGIAPGGVVELRTRFAPGVWLGWRVRHEGLEGGVGFADVSERGPFASWRHEHRFEPRPGGGSALADWIRYRLPGGELGRVLAAATTRSRLERMFRYRHSVTRDDLVFWHNTRQCARMRVVVTGAGGMVGSALLPFLSTQGHETVALSRSGGGDSNRAVWNPDAGELDPAVLDGANGIVHLAGANIAEGRWTRSRKREILESRVNSTRLLVEAMRKSARRPEVLVCASATGYYGDTGDVLVDEDAPSGKGFLAEVCRAWEAEAMRAAELGVRVVLLRNGVVLDPRGGALAKLLPVFRAGLGGPVGGGRQWMSWSSIDDTVGAILFALLEPTLAGPVNAVSPQPVTNADFAHALGRVLGRPSVAPAPATALKLLYGQMAEETVLASSRVDPRRLSEAGYPFRHPDPEGALRHVLGK